MGFKGVFIARPCFPDEEFQIHFYHRLFSYKDLIAAEIIDSTDVCHLLYSYHFPPKLLVQNTKKNINGQMSHRIRKPTTNTGENKGAEQLCSACSADHRLCFRYTDIMIPLLLQLVNLCGTCSETRKIGFLAFRLINGQKLSPD